MDTTVWGPCIAAVLGVTAVTATPAAQDVPRIPLRVGLTIVTAVNEVDEGDYESIKRFIEANDKQLRLVYSADLREEDKKVRTVRGARTIARADLETSTEYRNIFGELLPESYPGSTAVGVSRRVLTDLKTKNRTTLSVPVRGLGGALGSLMGALLGESAKEMGLEETVSGTLERIEKQPVPFKVLVNDRLVELPAVHARGRFGDYDAEFWVLDDPDNPLALKWIIDEAQLQVIRLSFPIPTPTDTATGSKPSNVGEKGNIRPGSGAAGGEGQPGGAAAGLAKRIETDLAKEGRSIIYGIYFDFDSDRIKEESEPVLAEIAQVMKQNPTWNLAVEGHTDNIAGDAYNLQLSQRRAAAVKSALTGRYGIQAARLTTAGFGESRPRDRNDTLEGRARNRRVELVKSN